MSEKRKEPPDRLSGNELNFLVTGGLTTLANRLASPQIVLPWVYNIIGGPLFLVGFIVPFVRLGGLFAQLTLVPTLLARQTRKWAYFVASMIVGIVLLVMCVAALELKVFAAATIFFAGTLMLGGCNGIILLTSQEVMAKSVLRNRIGLLLAKQASIGGVLTLLVVVTMMYVYPDDGTKAQHLVLIVIAALVTLLAGAVFVMLHEPVSVVQKRRSAWKETLHGWKLYRATPWFRQFFRTRALFLSVGLAMPFYSIHAATEYESGSKSLSLFVLATGVTTIFSGVVWSKLLSKSPGRVLIWSGYLAAAAGFVAMIRAVFPQLSLPLMYVVVFSLLTLAVQGLAQSSKTYLALMTPEDERPLYLAINNALLGVVAVVVSGLIGLVAHSVHIYAALGLLIVMALVASYSARSLVPISLEPRE